LSPGHRAIGKYTPLLSMTWGQAVTRPHKIQLDQLGHTTRGCNQLQCYKLQATSEQQA